MGAAALKLPQVTCVSYTPKTDLPDHVRGSHCHTQVRTLTLLV